MTAPSLLDIADQVRTGKRSARSVVTEALATIQERNDACNAFVAVDAARAIADAEALDRRVVHDGPVGPLAGVPLAVKDTEDAVGYRTTHGSRAWANAAPAETDSVLVQRLKSAGCIVVGRTNTPELATKGTTDNLVFGVTRNPHDRTRTAGGSSGGSAAAVAGGMVPLATASDGGGSIRIPASACGIPGFKPSLGRIPDGGPRPVDWLDLTTRGVLTRSVAELLAVLDVVVGPDPTDLRSLPAPSVPFSVAVDRRDLPRRVGFSATLGYADVDPDVLAACRRTLDRLAADGVDIVEVPAVFTTDPARIWMTLVAAYVSRSVHDIDHALLDPALAAMVATAQHTTAYDLIEAEDDCHRLNLELLTVFARCDLLLTPTLAFDPEVIGASDQRWIRATYPFNLTRSPAGTIPIGVSPSGMPIGLQIVGPQHDDVGVLALMRHLDPAAR